MARGIPYGKENRHIACRRFGKGSVVKRLPMERVLGVLAKVSAWFTCQPVHLLSLLLLRRGCWAVRGVFCAVRVAYTGRGRQILRALLAGYKGITQVFCLRAVRPADALFFDLGTVADTANALDHVADQEKHDHDNPEGHHKAQ